MYNVCSFSLLLWVPFLSLLRPTACEWPYRPFNLKCYTCSSHEGVPCDKNFDRSKANDDKILKTCDSNRPDNATEMCAKIVGSVLYDANNRTEPGEPFFAKGCFPIGDAWIWRTEPYNETVMFGNVTIWGSVYICRNTRCNGDFMLTSSEVTWLGALIFLLVSQKFTYILWSL